MNERSVLAARHEMHGLRLRAENLSLPSAEQYSYASRLGSRLPASMAFFSGPHDVSMSQGVETRFDAFGNPYTQTSTE